MVTLGLLQFLSWKLIRCECVFLLPAGWPLGAVVARLLYTQMVARSNRAGATTSSLRELSTFHTPLWTRRGLCRHFCRHFVPS